MSIKDKYVAQIVSYLATQGKRIVNECLTEKDYEHDTLNLHDSYGYGIYVEGKLVQSYTTEQNAGKGKKWYGRNISGHEAIMDFLNSYEASKGIELAIVAAMPYAEVLENASGGQRRKYKVISMSYDKLKLLQTANASLGATVHRIVRGKKSTEA